MPEMTSGPIHVSRNIRIHNRELSWLEFNGRVLQEAADKRNPLYERIKFLAIYSSNLDEFFRVRVASIRSLLALRKTSQKALPLDPEKLLKKARRIVATQQHAFGRIYRHGILPDLKAKNIFIVNEKELTESQAEFARAYFREQIAPDMRPYYISRSYVPPIIQNRQLYFVVDLALLNEETKEKTEELAIVAIPASLPRFAELPREGKKMFVMFIDDVIRLCLKELFPRYEARGAYAVKLTRDAEMHIDDEFEGDILEKIQQGLRNRKRGIPSRFLYDSSMPEKALKALVAFLRLRPNDITAGGRYHNFSDFFQFPKPDNPKLFDKPLAPLPVKELDEAKRLMPLIAERDVLLHYPYQSYEYVIRFLREAAKDAAVTSIKITLYRVATSSAVVEALKEAAANGKDVTAFVEVKARFDEESNLFWAGELERAGVTVLYSFPGLKVHAKLLIVTRIERDEKKRYAYMATGNFNEKTATLYTDLGLFTSHEKLTREVNEVFRVLSRKERSREFKELLVAPFNMRATFLKWIDAEIANAKEGRRASIVMKVNSLEDPEMIGKLYEASKAGVSVRLIVRGICCLVPGMEGVSTNIKAISIVDRFLEHARIFMFHNNGEERILMGSADWMTRNLTSRIEVVFPLYDDAARQTIKDVLGVQQKDNVKARIIAKGKTNAYRRNSSEKVRSQVALYEYFRKK